MFEHTVCSRALCTKEINRQTSLPVFLALEEAHVSHSLHHQIASALRLQFKISREVARGIVQACGHCPTFLPCPPSGVNPRGLRPNDLQQMDVTHIPFSSSFFFLF